MVKKPVVQRGLNGLLMLSLLAFSLVFLVYTRDYGLLLAPLAWAITFGVFKHNRWAYFASAAWALACYQLSKEGLEFDGIRRAVMVLSIPLVVLSIYLHETLGRRNAPAKGTNG